MISFLLTHGAGFDTETTQPVHIYYQVVCCFLISQTIQKRSFGKPLCQSGLKKIRYSYSWLQWLYVYEDMPRELSLISEEEKKN